MSSNQSKMCPICDLIVLGSDPPFGNFSKIGENWEVSIGNFSNTTADFWISHHHFRGMALNSRNFHQIFNCSQSFCEFDEYNSDFSLMYANLNCFKSAWRAFIPWVSRVVHVGTCGFHRKAKKEICYDKASEIRTFFQDNKEKLFPRQLAGNPLDDLSSRPLPPHPIGYGRWGDKRDRDLCMQIGQDFDARRLDWTDWMDKERTKQER